jgi:hypothetical protein
MDSRRQPVPHRFSHRACGVGSELNLWDSRTCPTWKDQSKPILVGRRLPFQEGCGADTAHHLQNRVIPERVFNQSETWGTPNALTLILKSSSGSQSGSWVGIWSVKTNKLVSNRPFSHWPAFLIHEVFGSGVPVKDSRVSEPSFVACCYSKPGQPTRLCWLWGSMPAT